MNRDDDHYDDDSCRDKHRRRKCWIELECEPCHDDGHQHKKCASLCEFAEVFSNATQTLAPSMGANQKGQVVLLENLVTASAGIDTTQAAANGKVIVNKKGWYDVSLGACGSLNPVASPLAVWTLSLFKNGVIVPGSTFANMTLSPEQKANEIATNVLVHCGVGDVLELANTSTAPIVLTSPVLGTNAAANSALLKILLIKAE